MAGCFTDNYACYWEMLWGKDSFFNQTRHPLVGNEKLEECLSLVVISDLEVYREEPYFLFDKQVARSKDVALIVDECCAGLSEMFLRLAEL